MKQVTYERPMPAKLMVRLENGEEFEATAEDIERFGYVDVVTRYRNLDSLLMEAVNDVVEFDVRDKNLSDHSVVLSALRGMVAAVVVFDRPLEDDEMVDLRAAVQTLIEDGL